jgi:formylaminopyrimidine deformylase
MTIDRAAAEAVLSRIEQDELVELVLHLSRIESPPGFDGEVGEAIHAWLLEHAFEAQRIGMFEDRFNVFAEVRGPGPGPALAFNAHMDISLSRDDHLTTRDPSRPEFHIGWEDGDMLIGNPVVNDKGPMSALMIAAKAIRDAPADGARLRAHRASPLFGNAVGGPPRVAAAANCLCPTSTSVGTRATSMTKPARPIETP